MLIYERVKFVQPETHPKSEDIVNRSTVSPAKVEALVKKFAYKTLFRVEVSYLCFVELTCTVTTQVE